MNIILLSIIAVIEGLQIVIASALILRFFPMESNLGDVLLPHLLSQLMPEREMFLYRLFVMSTIFVQGMGIFIFRKRLEYAEFSHHLRQFLIAEFVLLALMLFGLFKMAIYDNAAYAKVLFTVAFGLSLLMKITWFKMRLWLPRISQLLFCEKNILFWNRFMDCLMPVFIFLIIYIPNRRGLVAHIYQDERFFHLDGFVVGPAWAALKGRILNVDVFSQYGVGMPLMIGHLSQFWGGFDYEKVLTLLIFVTIFYFILSYILLRIWFKDALLAAVGVIFAIKFKMFFLNEENLVIWKYPSATIVRYFFDIFFLIFLWLHVQYQLKRYLWAALVCTGISLFYVMDTGVYQLLVLYAYIILVLSIPHCRHMICARRRDVPLPGLTCVFPLLVALFLFWSVSGNHIFQSSYWTNMTEYVALAVGGFGAIPLYHSLQEKQFLAFFLGGFIVLVYVFTVIINLSLIYLKKINEKNIFAIIVSLYGLCLYHYYIFRSSSMNYHPVCIPVVFIGCYWASRWIQNFYPAKKYKFFVALFLFACFSLWTTHAYRRYPNIFHQREDAFAAEKKMMAEDLSIEEDARLIAALTDEDERVCLISSFEAAILMKADRSPFFYYFPLLSPRFMRMKDFGGTRLTTKKQFGKIMDQLEKSRPKYIFVEKKLILREIPNIYYNHYANLGTLMQYIQNHYIPLKSGKYLMALQRK